MTLPYYSHRGLCASMGTAAGAQYLRLSERFFIFTAAPTCFFIIGAIQTHYDDDDDDDDNDVGLNRLHHQGLTVYVPYTFYF